MPALHFSASRENCRVVIRSNSAEHRSARSTRCSGLRLTKASTIAVHVNYRIAITFGCGQKCATAPLTDYYSVAKGSHAEGYSPASL